MKIKEYLYLLYRIVKSQIYSFFYYFFKIFPIRKNQIVFINFEGKKGFGDNPKAIAECIFSLYGKTKYRIVWLANNIGGNEFPNYIKTIENTALKRAFYLTTSGIWVDNHRKGLEVRKRKKQFYIATWHGMIGFKKVGALRGKELPKISERVSRHDSSMVDCFLSNSEWCTNTIKTAFFYDKLIVKTGSPRCDICITHSESYREKTLTKYGLSAEKKYLLHAPTFRGYNQNIKMQIDSKENVIRYATICNALSQKYGGDWAVLYKSHPGVSGSHEAQKECEDISHLDLYEILPCIDFFISDYSSCVFDAAVSGLPVFLFVDDIEEYNERRGLLWDMNVLPFPVCRNESDLIHSIELFDLNQYRKELSDLFLEIKLLEDGNASKRVVDMIDAWYEEGRKQYGRYHRKI